LEEFSTVREATDITTCHGYHYVPQISLRDTDNITCHGYHYVRVGQLRLQTHIPKV